MNETVTEDGMEFSIDEYGATLVKVVQASESVEVPESVHSSEGPVAVISVGQGAFSGSTVASVRIPEGTVNVAKEAFSGCQSLSSVELPSTLMFIGARAFYGCVSLTEIRLPPGLR